MSMAVHQRWWKAATQMALKSPTYRSKQYQEPRTGAFTSGRFQPLWNPLPTPFWYGRIRCSGFCAWDKCLLHSEEAKWSAVNSFICYGSLPILILVYCAQKAQYQRWPNLVLWDMSTCRDLPPHQNWIFIFIIPYGVETLECSYPESPELQELSPCSSQIVTENSTTLVLVASLLIKGGEEQLPHKNQKSLRHPQKNRRLKEVKARTATKETGWKC